MNAAPRDGSSSKVVCTLCLTLAALCLLPLVAPAQNTENDFTGGGAASILVAGNWSLGGLPTVTNDAVFTATTGIRPMSAGDLTVGSFNVTTNAGTFTIRSATATATDSILTLGGAGNGGNAVSGTAGDLLYVATGSTFSIAGANGSSGTGVVKINLGQSGNFNAAGTLIVSAAISDGGSGYGITKTGAGTLTLTNNHNTYTGGTIITAGTLVVSEAGTLGSGNIGVGSGAKLNLSGLNTTFTLSGSQVLTNRGAVVGGLLIGTNAWVTGGGSFSGAVTNQSGGTLTPGVGGDTNYFDTLTLNGDSTNVFWLGSAAQHDMSVATNSLAYGGASATDAPVFQLDLSSWNNSANIGQTMVLYDNFAPVTAWDGTNKLFRLSDATGLFDGALLTNGMVFTVSGSGAGTFKINYDLEGGGGAGNGILLTVIPEPASLNLLAILGAAYFVRRRSQRTRALERVRKQHIADR